MKIYMIFFILIILNSIKNALSSGRAPKATKSPTSGSSSCSYNGLLISTKCYCYFGFSGSTCSQGSYSKKNLFFFNLNETKF
jgi:hypothetical protein